MRIAIDSRDAVAREARGWGRYARELVHSLNDRDDVDLVRLDEGWRGLPEFAWEQLGLARAARRRGAEVLHVPNCFLPLRRGGLPGVVTVHDLAFEEYPEDFARLTRRKFAWMTPRAARGADAVIVPTRHTAHDLVRRYAVDPATIHVIPEAPALATGDATPPPGPYLLGVGDLRAKKNWGRLVAAWRALRADGLPHRLILAGRDAGEAERLRAAAGDDPLEITGFVSDAGLDALLRGADALVHPSLYEGFGLVVLEAQIRGTPVAAAGNTALPEAGGEAGVYFDPHDVEGIAAAIRETLARRDELSAASRAHAAGFSWRATAEQTVAVYREVVR